MVVHVKLRKEHKTEDFSHCVSVCTWLTTTATWGHKLAMQLEEDEEEEERRKRRKGRRRKGRRRRNLIRG